MGNQPISPGGEIKRLLLIPKLFTYRSNLNERNVTFFTFGKFLNGQTKKLIKFFFESLAVKKALRR
jgi:hypothetical protein